MYRTVFIRLRLNLICLFYIQSQFYRNGWPDDLRVNALFTVFKVVIITNLEQKQKSA